MPVNHEEFFQHKPLFEDLADSIMDFINSLSPSQIAERLSISNSLAVKAHSLAFEFPYKLSGYKAVFGFTGEAFKGFDASSLSPDGLSRTLSDLFIVSSVYGLLHPSDIIKPYRCEFNKPINPGNKTSIQIFKAKNTAAIVNYIKERKIKDIINLLPGDADKCLDWKIIRAFASVHKICFQQILPDGGLKTPLAKRLKELRGIMARTIMEENIQTFTELKDFQSNQFIYSSDHSKPGMPVFITD